MPRNVNNLKNKDHLENEVDPKNDDNLKNKAFRMRKITFQKCFIYICCISAVVFNFKIIFPIVTKSRERSPRPLIDILLWILLCKPSYWSDKSCPYLLIHRGKL